MDPRVEALADVLVNYSVAVKPGDWVVIQSPPLAEPLVAALVRACLKAGAYPSPMMYPADVREMYLRLGNDDVDPSTFARDLDVEITSSLHHGEVAGRFTYFRDDAESPACRVPFHASLQ